MSRPPSALVDLRPPLSATEVLVLRCKYERIHLFGRKQDCRFQGALRTKTGGEESAMAEENEDGAHEEEQVEPEEEAKEISDETEVGVEQQEAGDEEEDNTLAVVAKEEEVEEEAPKVTVDDIKTAPMDYRFPTTNQAKHCYTRYNEFHKCVAEKGEDAPECGKYARYYRSLCPGEWIDKWNEQREGGTFAGRY